ncbi:MAG: hypothetical protein CMF42_00955 [Legionellales bacterium]|nr:hypothetical protein [Legionellales bacterium]|tara:strand:- start:3108 stop:3446 length:339 start_codon:yes stop_codon:yes gene_type:complete
MSIIEIKKHDLRPVSADEFGHPKYSNVTSIGQVFKDFITSKNSHLNNVIAMPGITPPVSTISSQEKVSDTIVHDSQAAMTASEFEVRLSSYKEIKNVPAPGSYPIPTITPTL